MADVLDEIKRVMPKGTRSKDTLAQRDLTKKKDRWRLFPSWPPDAFAVAAHLLKITGAYQYTNFNPNLEVNGDPYQIYGAHRRNLEIIGGAWANAIPIPEFRNDKDVPELSAQSSKKFHWLDAKPEEFAAVQETDIQGIWQNLATHKNSFNVPELPEYGGKIPDWWKYVVQLLIIADQASKGLGFSPAPDTTFTIMQVILTEGLIAPTGNVYETQVCENLVQPGLVDTDLFAVMPKSRTPSVGWTLRSLTHNLAFVPPGEARVMWYYNPISPAPASGSEGTPLNVLVIPFPYAIKSEAFYLTKIRGEFGVRQSWLANDRARKQITDLVDSLIYEACEDGIPVNAVVFPELSLDFDTFDLLSSNLAREHPNDFEFIISGLSDRLTQSGKKQHGNFVGIRGRLRGWRGGDSIAGDEKLPWDYQSFRGKHHRWRIDDRQARRYGIRHRFSDSDQWWESIAIGKRRIDIFEPRAGLTMTTLICEDLARTDPCQDVIRSIGPNLVISLLMDGPQIARRWPAHYAGVLADDPGCSVLTVDSFGLINRAAQCGEKGSRSIAFWKDFRGEQQEIEIFPEHRGLLLSLRADSFEEVTLDGRKDGGVAAAWHLSQVIPLAGDSSLSVASW